MPKCNLLIPEYTKSGLQGVLFLIESHPWAVEESIDGLRDGVLLYVSPCFDIDRFIGQAGLTEGATVFFTSWLRLLTCQLIAGRSSVAA